MKILLIRGGALGDFIVTLPMLRRLREQWPAARIELLGHPHLAEPALHRHYLDATRSVNHRTMSAFFMPRAVLEPSWMDYIGSFDLVLSYFYDPDELFLRNLQRCEPGRIATLSPRVPEDWREPAARHFARILEPLGLDFGPAADPASELFPTAGDLEAARAFLGGLENKTRLVSLHPGSGGEAKNGALEDWAELGRQITRDPTVTLLLIEGEVEQERARLLAAEWKDLPLLRARLLPLPILAAVLGQTACYVGHDSGVTHLAAAARRDLPVIALFGPATDPVVWAPPRAGVEVIRETTTWPRLPVAEVVRAVRRATGS